jgi:hypothetical protein
MSTTEKVTIWDRIVKIEHNHIESGWVEGDKPQPLSPDFTKQENWDKSQWIKRHGYLVDGKVIEIPDPGE